MEVYSKYEWQAPAAVGCDVALRKDGMERRELLLDAALACFSEEGVLGTGIERIRQRAGASPSSVYHYFDDVSDLTVALLVRTFERLFGHLCVRVAPARTARAIVLALVDGHLEWILAHRDEGRFMYQATSMDFAPDAGAALQARKGELLAPIARQMQPFVESGALPPWSVLQLDVVLLGASHEGCRRLLAGAPIDPRWMRATFPRLAWATMQRARRET